MNNNGCGWRYPQLFCPEPEITKTSSEIGASMTMLLGGDKQASSADFNDHVTREAIDGLFQVIVEQEKKIRDNPTARTSDLLRRVFR